MRTFRRLPLLLRVASLLGLLFALASIAVLIEELTSSLSSIVLMAEQTRGRPLPYLKAWRIEKLMTQADLVARSRVGRATVVRAERGDEAVSFTNIRKIAEALGISTDELLHTDPEARS